MVLSLDEVCLHDFFPHMYISAPPCVDFGLPAVLCIAFGGFLIGVLLIGALWFIKIKTGKFLSKGSICVFQNRSECGSD